MSITIFILSMIIISLVFKPCRDFYKSLYYCFKTPKNPMDDIMGMIGYLGYYGSGKSLALTDTLNKYKKLADKQGAELRIYTNYFYNGQTAPLTCLDDIVRICDEKRNNKDDNSYTIFAIDELQNCLNSRQWNDTKKLESLLPIFTMTRKLKVMFLYTSPVLSMSDKTIRVSSRCVYVCKKVNRFYFVRWKVNPTEIEGKSGFNLRLIPHKFTLLDENLKNSYDSFAFIETLQKQDYLTHAEASTINYFENIIKVPSKKAK